MPSCQALRNGTFETATDEELAAGVHRCGANPVHRVTLRSGEKVWLCSKHRGRDHDLDQFELVL